MSSDDTIYVQVNDKKQIVAQWGSMSADVPPNPNEARPEEVFDTLVEFFEGSEMKASETEYGFTFLLQPDDFQRVAERGPAKGPWSGRLVQQSNPEENI